MNDLDFKVIEAYLIDRWSHRRIQNEILELDAPLRGGGYKTMQILHEYGITKEYKGILVGQKLNRDLLEETRKIEVYLERL